jgi:nucleoside-diphosphate-sugar epimerase
MVHPTLNANLVSTVNLLVAATKNGCQRFLTAGSLEEPDPGEKLPIPSSPYAAAKLASSSYARMFHALYGTPVVMARIFMVYGPAQRDLRKLVPYVILSLLRELQPELASGKRLVDWIYVDDVVDGLLKMLVTPGIEGNTIELGSSRLETTGAIAETIHRLIGNDVALKIGALSDRPMERVIAANLAESERKLGWKPKISLEEGLRRTIDWYKAELESGRISYNILEKYFQFKL